MRWICALDYNIIKKNPSFEYRCFLETFCSDSIQYIYGEGKLELVFRPGFSQNLQIMYLPTVNVSFVRPFLALQFTRKNLKTAKCRQLLDNYSFWDFNVPHMLALGFYRLVQRTTQVWTVFKTSKGYSSNPNPNRAFWLRFIVII